MTGGGTQIAFPKAMPIVFGLFFFKTEKMTLDHAFNEGTGTVRIQLRYTLISSQLSVCES